ncbi:MAG: PKD domain-containing protein [Methanoregula sp.]|uniref:PKD domain-containing protein n=1 Tax=Methanoregula sp. TaxID=2052170 RepID=UPI003C1F13C1
MNTDTFFLVFCLTIVILGIVIAPAAADNTTVTAAPNATATPTGTVTPTATATTAVTATTAATTTVTTVATTSPTTVPTTAVAAVAPVAAFSASPASGTAPLIVQFTDASTNTPTGWIWSFGDGMGNSTLQNPSYTYANAGTYTVTLTAINSAGSSVTTNSITVSSAAATVTATTVPVPAFYGTPTSGTVPLTVQFTDTSTGSPANWTWDFGDGNTSTLEDPSYTYVSNGTYDVQLIATNAAGSNVTTQTGYIVVGDTVPVTGFSASPTTGTAPLIVGFTDTSSGTPTSWTWDFGDGTTGSDENPSHTYSSEGTYSVSLIASNTAGSNTSVQSDYIKVSAATDVTTTVTTEVTSTDSDTPAPVSTYVVPVPAQQVSVSSPASSGKSATSTDAWLTEENQKMAAMDAETTATPQQTDIVSSIVGFFESLFSWI